MIIGCTGNYRKSEYVEIVNHINKFLSNKSIRCIVSSDILNSDSINEYDISELDILDFSELENLSDIILCIGGDGTFLSTARRMNANKKVPLLGIHIGGLGFLAGISRDNIDESLQSVIDEEYQVENRMRIQLKLKRDGMSEDFTALNAANLSTFLDFIASLISLLI